MVILISSRLFHLLNYSYFREEVPHLIVYSPILNYSGCKERKESFLALRAAAMTTGSGKELGKIPLLLPPFFWTAASSNLLCMNAAQKLHQLLPSLISSKVPACKSQSWASISEHGSRIPAGRRWRGHQFGQFASQLPSRGASLPWSVSWTQW